MFVNRTKELRILKTAIDSTEKKEKNNIAIIGNRKIGKTELILELKKRQVDFAALSCLVPNLKGLEIASELGIKEIAVFTATSETFNQKNINATIEESFTRIKEVCELAKKNDIKIRGYVSTVFGCPYEGSTSIESMLHVTKRLFELGCYEVSLGDTIGIAYPEQVLQIYAAIKKNFDEKKIAWHFHDTRGLAVANIHTAYMAGARIFDASAAGLGGCPYAKGASGNVATEDVLQLFKLMKIETGVDIEKVALASKFILKELGRQSASKAYQAIIAEKA